jgi:hypothetical protein
MRAIVPFEKFTRAKFPMGRKHGKICPNEKRESTMCCGKVGLVFSFQIYAIF